MPSGKRKMEANDCETIPYHRLQEAAGNLGRPSYQRLPAGFFHFLPINDGISALNTQKL